MNSSKTKVDPWRLLHVFQNKVRVEIVKLLSQCEMASLSEIAEKLEHDPGRKITLPGVLKHMKKLEKAGIVRQESGIYLKPPDARKTIYLLEGKERVDKILEQLERNVGDLLRAGVIFSRTAKLARKIQGITPRHTGEREHLESLLAQCQSEEVNRYLTEDERKKVKFWRMMIEFLRV